MLLDGTSQRTFATKRFLESIKATFHHSEKSDVKGFGGISTEKKVVEVVESVLSMPGFLVSLTIQAKVVERICSPLRRTCISDLQKTYPHL